MLVPADANSKRILFEREKAKNVIPLDQKLGVFKLPFKMTAGLMLTCAYWAQNKSSYEKAEEALYMASSIHINDDTIRQAANCVGKIVFEEDCRRTEEVFKQHNAGLLAFPKNRTGVLYIGAKCAAINTRHKGENGSSWCENMLGIVFSSDNIHYWTDMQGQRRHHIKQREYVSCIGSADMFKRQLFACACRNGYGAYKETVILSDGAEWIAQMAEELFPDAQRILDLFHLRENVCSFAKSKFSRDEAVYTSWAKDTCERLENGQWQGVLRELDPNEKYPNCVNLYHYIHTNRDAMNYPEYKAKGFFVESGAAEDGNKAELQARLRQAGMRWEPTTAQYLLTLRAKKASGLWERDVVKVIKDYYK